MKIIEGNITLLGSATISKELVKYSVIELDGQILQQQSIPKVLDNFLVRALNQTGPSKLYLWAGIIYGVQGPDGKLYCLDTSKKGAVIVCVIGVILTPIIIGIPLIINGAYEYGKANFTQKLLAIGGIPLSAN